MMGGCRKLCNEEIHNLYTSPNIIGSMKFRRMAWAGHVVHMGEMRNVEEILDGKPDGKRLLRRFQHR
jgi:hypothetical protein